jgi:hypothetical protein
VAVYDAWTYVVSSRRGFSVGGLRVIRPSMLEGSCCVRYVVIYFVVLLLHSDTI